MPVPQCEACFRPAVGSTEAFVTVKPWRRDTLSLLLASLPLMTWTRIRLCHDHLREMVERCEDELDDTTAWHPDNAHPTLLALGSRRDHGQAQDR